MTKKMKFNRKHILFLFFLLPFAGYSQTNGYSYQRKLNKPESAKYYSVALSPEISAQLKSGWNDIRILNFSEKDTAEVPYLLETLGNSQEEKTVPFELINNNFEKEYSYLTLKINEKKVVNRIKLTVTDASFDKWLQVEGSNDNKSWFTIKERLRIVRFYSEYDQFEYTTLDFPNSQYGYYRLKFDNTFSKRLDVTGAYAFETAEKKGRYNDLKINSWKQTENKKEKKSEVIVEFPVDYKVNHIVISSKNDKDFYRNINVYRFGGIIHTPKGDRENWYVLNTGVFSSLHDNHISCFDNQTKKLKIEIINNDDQPVEISDIKAFAEQTHLVAELPVSDNLYLVYGKENASAPVYDLVHFKEKIPATIPEIAYGAEQSNAPILAASNPLTDNKNWLWASMGVIMLVIGFFSYRMLKRENE